MNKRNDGVDDVPPVIPLIQSETRDDGTVLTKRVKPLTYSLINWVKRYLNLPDTVDISDDEDSAQFQITISSPDEEYSYSCYFNTDELNGYIMFYMYYFDDLIPKNKEKQIKDLIFERNSECLTGQVQIVTGDAQKSIRYYSGICVKGIASEDPNYSGEFQISPMLYQNMFDNGYSFMNNFIQEYKQTLSS